MLTAVTMTLDTHNGHSPWSPTVVLYVIVGVFNVAVGLQTLRLVADMGSRLVTA